MLLIATEIDLKSIRQEVALDDVRKIVRSELISIRHRGYVKLEGDPKNNLERKETPFLDRVARSHPDVDDRMTRVEAIGRLLEVEALQVVPYYNKWLVILFGLRAVANEVGIEGRVKYSPTSEGRVQEVELNPYKPGPLLGVVKSLSKNDSVHLEAIDLLADHIVSRYRETLLSVLEEVNLPNTPEELTSFAGETPPESIHSQEAQADTAEAVGREATGEVPVSGTMEPPPKSERDRKLVFPAIIIALALTLGVVVITTPWSDGREALDAGKNLSESSAGVPPEISPTVATSTISPTSTTSTPSSDPVAKPTLVTNGKHIRATITGVSNGSDGWSVAYSLGDRTKAQPFLDHLDTDGLPFENSTQFLIEQLQAGAYSLGGIKLTVELEGLSDREVTVYGIRPRKQRQAVPLGDAVIIYNQGGGPSDMTFDLDHAQPRPKTYDRESGNLRGYYFVVEELKLKPGAKKTLLMRFELGWGAYHFDILVDYEVNGQRFTQELRLGDQPFRVASFACPSWQKERGRTSQQITQARYKSVRAMTYDDKVQDYVVKRVAPDTFAKDCLEH